MTTSVKNTHGEWFIMWKNIQNLTYYKHNDISLCSWSHPLDYSKLLDAYMNIL